jgi:hypothetical protein
MQYFSQLMPYEDRFVNIVHTPMGKPDSLGFAFMRIGLHVHAAHG